MDITGRAAHAGLDPGSGASAVAELASVVRRLHALTDPALGTTVNVGVVSGGTRPNVVAARARAEVDVRVTSLEEGRRVEAAILAMEAETPGVVLAVRGHLGDVFSAGLLVGGALGNVIDRFDDGAVVDWFDLGWWPAFNVADAAITVGIAWLLVQTLRGPQPADPGPPPAQAPTA